MFLRETECARWSHILPTGLLLDDVVGAIRKERDADRKHRKEKCTGANRLARQCAFNIQAFKLQASGLRSQEYYDQSSAAHDHSLRN